MREFEKIENIDLVGLQNYVLNFIMHPFIISNNKRNHIVIHFQYFQVCPCSSFKRRVEESGVRVKPRLCSPHHREVIFPLERFHLTLFQLDNMGHARAFVNLLHKFLDRLFIALDFTFDLCSSSQSL